MSTPLGVAVTHLFAECLDATTGRVCEQGRRSVFHNDGTTEHS